MRGVPFRGRSSLRALLFAGAVMTLSYMAGTVAMLVALPSSSISGVQGFARAIESLSAALQLRWLVVPVMGLIVLNSVGGAAAFLSSTSRLPFVAGMDRYLPSAFGRIHRRWRTPWVAIGVYGLAGMLCALLSQAGSTVRSAYDVMVSMSILTYFIPFLFLFASMIRLQCRAIPASAIRIPGGRPAAVVLASIGLLTTLLTIVLSIVPPDEEPHKLLAMAKVIGSTLFLVGAGVVVYLASAQRRKQTA